MKLISLNIEGRKHLDLVHGFLQAESPDILCLTEVLEDEKVWLEEQGFHTTFAPMYLVTEDGEVYKKGIMFASKEMHTAEILIYHKPKEDVVAYDVNDKRATIRHLVIFANVDAFQIAVTHFTWNAHGEKADDFQMADMENMLDILSKKPPHVLCGDLNIPRNINELYDVFVQKYTDAIPHTYKSSLDRNLHRCGSDQELQMFFTDFMVDYLFTQKPFTAKDTKLVFGVSDHAAVVSTLSVQ